METKKAFPFNPATLHSLFYLLPPRQCKAMRNEDCQRFIIFPLTLLSSHTSFPAPAQALSLCCSLSDKSMPVWVLSMSHSCWLRMCSFTGTSPHTKTKVMASQHQQKQPIYKNDKTPVLGPSQHCNNKIFPTIIPLFWVFPVQVLSTASLNCCVYL